VPEISLTIVGDGKCRDRLRDLASEKGVEHAIEWISRIPRDKVLEVYDRHDLVILTSLHDSGGTVILEAFARGLPVICLQLGGPGLLVNANCGACIDTHGRSMDQVVHAIAEELIRFCRMSDAEATKIRNAAYDRAEHFSPKEVVGKAYEWFSELSGIMDKSQHREAVMTDRNPGTGSAVHFPPPAISVMKSDIRGASEPTTLL
jgi:glycosyltransferase involved in cell wall biosynthesis